MTKTKFLLQRAAGYLAGFALFYEPFMLFGNLTGRFLIETGFTSIHVPCARIPLANIITGQWQESGPTSLFFCLLLAVTSIWFGPLFCGRLCPVGTFNSLFHIIGQKMPGPFKMQVRTNACVGCGRCAQACPMQAIELHERKSAINIQRCIVCGQCQNCCPVKAIRYGSNLQQEEPRHEK